MRTLIILIAIQLCVISLNAQVNGRVKDEEGKPVKGATVSLLRSKDSALVKLAATQADGTFSFAGIKEGSYRVKSTFVGHGPLFSAPFSYSTGEVAVPEMVMKKLAGNMKEVVVTAQAID